MYDDIVNMEISRFENELAEMLKSITKTIDELKHSIVSQLEEFKLSYQKVQMGTLRLKNSCSRRSKNPSRLVIWPATSHSKTCSPLRTTRTALD